MEKIDATVVIEDEDIKEEEFTPEELEADTTDWKAKALELKGIAKRRATQLAKVKEKLASVKPEPEPKPQDKVENKKSDDTDYAQEAFLVAHGIKEADEKELLKERMTATGQSLKEVLGNKYFQQDLEGLREAKAVKVAVPSGQNRSGSSVRDTVDYWKAKIASGKATLLDIPDVQLRRDIVNSNLKQAKDVNHFTTNPFGTIDITK